jgi:hypothetical protein
MRLTFWLFLFVVSCTSNKSASSKDRYEAMNDLWQNKANKSEVISTLGTKYQVAPSGITYSFTTFNYPKSGHFFNQANQLIVQFIFLEKNEWWAGVLSQQQNLLHTQLVDTFSLNPKKFVFTYDFLHQKYFVEGLSSREIAAQTFSSRATVT